MSVPSSTSRVCEGQAFLSRSLDLSARMLGFWLNEIFRSEVQSWVSSEDHRYKRWANWGSERGTGTSGGPVTKTLSFPCRGAGSIPGQGTKIPHTYAAKIYF